MVRARCTRSALAALTGETSSRPDLAKLPMLVHMLVSMRAFETGHAENSHFIESTVYRVNFWSPGAAWALDAYVLTEAEDVTEVLRWADEHARGRRFEVFAEM